MFFFNLQKHHVFDLQSRGNYITSITQLQLGEPHRDGKTEAVLWCMMTFEKKHDDKFHVYKERKRTFSSLCESVMQRRSLWFIGVVEGRFFLETKPTVFCSFKAEKAKNSFLHWWSTVSGNYFREQRNEDRRKIANICVYLLDVKNCACVGCWERLWCCYLLLTNWKFALMSILSLPKTVMPGLLFVA